MKNKFALWLIMTLLVFSIFSLFAGNSGDTVKISYTRFIELVQTKEIQKVTIEGYLINGGFSNVKGQFYTIMPENDPSLLPLLRENGVEIMVEPRSGGGLWTILISWFPMLLLIGVWIWFMRGMGKGGSGGVMGFGKSKAKLNERSNRVTFADVAGCEEAKDEVKQTIEFLRNPQKFTRLGGKMPKGLLLMGAPGTGKTLLARAIAGEADVPFFTISGSDFVEMFVGVGASRVRDMFEQGKKSAPCIIFIDEIDAMGRKRGAGLGGGNDEREQTLNQLLVEMDGFEVNDGVILIAATNRPDVLDPALLRPGRFDRQIVIPNPDVKGREKILLVHMKNIPLAPDVDAKVIARGTPGFTGADLANLVNEAALLAAKLGRKVVTKSDMEESKDKVMMGTERKSMVLTDEHKKLTAYHEAGHAIVAVKTPGNDPVHKITIIPRGMALGLTMLLPEGDQLGFKKSELIAKMAMAFGGREAERLIFGDDDITTGASSDIKMASGIARRMVTEYGMSDKVGAVALSDGDQNIFLGEQIIQKSTISEKMANLIDTEIREFINKAGKHAAKVLADNMDLLHRTANALLEHETLDGDDFQLLVDGKEIIREEDAPVASVVSRGSVPSSGTSVGTTNELA